MRLGLTGFQGLMGFPSKVGMRTDRTISLSSLLVDCKVSAQRAGFGQSLGFGLI